MSSSCRLIIKIKKDYFHIMISNNISFLHIADIHIGMENYGYIDSQTGLHTRLLDFKKSLEFVVDYAIAKKLDLIIIAGDIYKNSYPTPTHQRIFVEAMMKLMDHHIPVVMITGNHDLPGNLSKAHALDIFNHLNEYPIYLFSDLSLKKINTKNGPVNIIALPWMWDRRLYTRNYVSSFIKNKLAESDILIPTIIVGHMTMKQGVFSGSEKQPIEGKEPIFDRNDLIFEGIDYVALGHLHRYQVILEDPCPIIYSGSLSHIDFGEQGEKKYAIHGVIQDKKTTFEPILIPNRPFFYIDIYLENIDISYVGQISEKIELYKKTENKEAIIKIRYHYPMNPRDEVIDHKEILEKLNDAFFLVVSLTCYNRHLIERKRNRQVTSYNQILTNISLNQLIEEYTKEQDRFKDKTIIYKTLIDEYEKRLSDKKN
jgi:exonuclease SbcD